ncbi:MAG TPA: hypothetical protein VHC47_08120 [Mucilaginibacter sp.]|nr:hypothetical protein [Mucilaginibacter sp.]
MNNSKEFTVHSVTTWKADQREQETIEIWQTEVVKENYLKKGLPEIA